jgi:hypothetical protein
MNIKKTVINKVAVTFPDASKIPVAMPRPAVKAPFKGDFKALLS